jgi:hypothetical protein
MNQIPRQPTSADETQKIRDALDALEARINRLLESDGTPADRREARSIGRQLGALRVRVVRLGATASDAIPQQRLEQLIDGSTGKAATA